MGSLRETTGHLEKGFAHTLKSDLSFLRAAVGTLLENHFPRSLHSNILAAVGLLLPEPGEVREMNVIQSKRRPRDPGFRQNVLRAYEHRCAITGFQMALGGQYFGCEAAHVQWHAYDGPDQVDNGFAVEPTLHKLFDAGAWSLSDDRRVIVSADLTGDSKTIDRVRGLHGMLNREPLSGEKPISVEYIQWHRERDLGGVFRQPALPL